jgi:MFS transporter, putative metabolite:H+ symporter
MTDERKYYGLWSLPVLVGALGFFVDIYDMLLFNIVRKSSLHDLGVADAAMKQVGEQILSWQMIGLTIGGITWGIIGDKLGRKQVLFGSIIIYSFATLANSMIQTVDQYVWVRFIAGLGLAGELGASITLTSELLPPQKRGPAAAIIATSGVMGTIVAYYIHFWSGENWRLCFMIGGIMGLLLLLLRVGVLESNMYETAKNQAVKMGDFRLILKSRERFFRYLRCIIMGLPVWYGIGILISFSDEFARKFDIAGFDQPRALMLQYVALAFGDLSAGFLSNRIKSRKITLLIFYLLFMLFFAIFFLTKGGGSATNMYLICMGLGFASGISVLYITLSAEQFGTNLRATAAISIPNLVRGFLPLILLLFQWLRSDDFLGDYVKAAWITGIIVIAAGLWSVLSIKEAFGRNLDYLEK